MFNDTLKQGEDIEKLILNAVKKKYPRAYKHFGNFKSYDIHIPETGKTIEVKYDKMAERTGNFAIETEYRGYLSGVEATEADYWVIYYIDRAYVIRPESLRYLLRTDDSVRVVSGGDDDNSKLKLININRVINSPYTKEWKI